MKWCPLDEIDGETEKLQYLVFEDWCWQWPGWKLIAKKLNDEFGNHRTANTCRLKSNALADYDEITRKGSSK